jgi:hypothetical protein
LPAQPRKIGSSIGSGENYKPILDVIHRIDFWTAATCRRSKARDMSAHSKMRASSPGESSLIRIIRGLGQYSSESAYYISLYGTPEFFMALQQFERNDFPPPNWMLPAEQRDDVVKRNSGWWRSNQNHKSGDRHFIMLSQGCG